MLLQRHWHYVAVPEDVVCMCLMHMTVKVAASPLTVNLQWFCWHPGLAKSCLDRHQSHAAPHTEMLSSHTCVSGAHWRKKTGHVYCHRVTLDSHIMLLPSNQCPNMCEAMAWPCQRHQQHCELHTIEQ